jgi:5-formyltetrahydrofolate cyclo-ligase
MSKLIALKKKDLRKTLAKKRNLIKKNSTLEFNFEEFSNISRYINFDEINYVASFISIRSEISTSQLNKKIIELNKTLLLPIVDEDSNELIFKKYYSNKILKLGKFNIPEPTKESEIITPQLFFVPCLGFDLSGYRLGYGGGFYDKTFAKYKKLNLKFYTIGYAFDDQIQSKVPNEDFDYKLDFVLTEKQLYTFL